MEDLDATKQPETKKITKGVPIGGYYSNAHMLDEPWEPDYESREKVETKMAKMGANEPDIKNCIHETYQNFFKDKDDDAKEPYGSLIPNCELIAPIIQKDLADKGFGNWQVVVGQRFSIEASLKKTENYASWKMGAINVAIFQMI